MRSVDDRFDRITEIERMLVRRPDGYTSGDLARHFDKDPATIYRDLAKLEKNRLHGRGGDRFCKFTAITAFSRVQQVSVDAVS
jgi:DeoR/GlpR family transcriptional regulator of sugar metabolism